MGSLQLTADALGDLFEQHGDALVAYFMRRTFDAELSFDLAAETFAEAVACRRRGTLVGFDAAGNEVGRATVPALPTGMAARFRPFLAKPRRK